MISQNTLLRTVTAEYLASIQKTGKYDLHEIEQELLCKLQAAFLMENSIRDKGNKMTVPQSLPSAVIAEIISALYHVRNIVYTDAGNTSDEPVCVLAIYEDEGPNRGTYTTDENRFRELIKQLNFSTPAKQIEDAIESIRISAPRVGRCRKANLVAVGNGIFDYDTKTLLPFTPDLVFTTKSHVNYNPNAVNVTLHNDEDGTDWDVESWMRSLSDDAAVVDLLWKILGAIIRPNVDWGKMAWFYSETGNNGKGTLCELMRALCGSGSYASISISDFSKDFMLEPLLKASAVIVDENDVGMYVDRVANLKAVVTGDVVLMNRKYKTPIPYQFKGFMVQCLNEFPRIRDRSGSFYRRQLFVPFEKCFTGTERKYIKQKYLHNQDVLEYVLYKVLNMNYYELDNPNASQRTLDEYKEFNDPILQFWNEVRNRFRWDFLPYDFIYCAYKGWFSKNQPSGSVQGKNSFLRDLKSTIKDSEKEWQIHDNKCRSKPLMQGPEPIILEYDMDEWRNQNYNGPNKDRTCTPDLLDSGYRGLIRRSASACVQDVEDDAKQ